MVNAPEGTSADNPVIVSQSDLACPQATHMQ